MGRDGHTFPLHVTINAPAMHDFWEFVYNLFFSLLLDRSRGTIKLPNAIFTILLYKFKL